MLTCLDSRGVRDNCQAVGCSRDSGELAGAKGHEAQFFGSYHAEHRDGFLTPLVAVDGPGIHLVQTRSHSQGSFGEISLCHVTCENHNVVGHDSPLDILLAEFDGNL